MTDEKFETIEIARKRLFELRNLQKSLYHSSTISIAGANFCIASENYDGRFASIVAEIKERLEFTIKEEILKLERLYKNL